MPRPRFDTLPPERRQQILMGATTAFARAGFHGASLNQILSATGISKGVFYYYFDDKTDLYGTVVERAITQFERVFEAHPAVEELSIASYWETLERSYRDLYAFSFENAEVVSLVRSLAELPPVEVANLQLDSRCLSWLRRYLERGRALGVVREDLPIEVLTELASAVDSAVGQWLFTNREVGVEAIEATASKVVGMLRRLLGPT